MQHRSSTSASDLTRYIFAVMFCRKFASIPCEWCFARFTSREEILRPSAVHNSINLVFLSWMRVSIGREWTYFLGRKPLKRQTHTIYSNGIKAQSIHPSYVQAATIEQKIYKYICECFDFRVTFSSFSTCFRQTHKIHFSLLPFQYLFSIYFFFSIDFTRNVRRGASIQAHSNHTHRWRWIDVLDHEIATEIAVRHVVPALLAPRSPCAHMPS